MWMKAVWIEGDREEECTIPACWVDRETKLVLWPDGKDATKHMRNQSVPTDQWLKFPLVKVKVTSEFQKRVLFLLSEMKYTIKEVGKKYDPSDTPVHLEQLSSLERFKDFNSSLIEDEDFQKRVVSQLSKIGGVSVKDNVRRIMKRIMTNELMSTFNMKGARGKTAFGNTAVKTAVTAGVMACHNATESAVDEAIAACLKYAPDRNGGGGRKLLN